MVGFHVKPVVPAHHSRAPARVGMGPVQSPAMAVHRRGSAHPEIRRELLLVAAFTAVGGLLRIWAPNRLGLVHFDEGIYALAGLWPFHRGGISAIDPTIIAYAPPGFPLLIGLFNLLLGVSDLAAILVSVVAGTLTIPVAAWLARRTFGPGSGASTAALVALSGFDVAFSRMALTDACFGLFWLVGLITCQRFLEKPGALSALAMGLATGAAQLIKYNGWLIGGLVILAAILGCGLDARERVRSRLLNVWGFGLLAGLVAWLVYMPWFRFVEAHGGYVSLLTHHRSYMGGVESWLPHLRLQLAQSDALSGNLDWRSAGLFLAWATPLFISAISFRRQHARQAAGISMATGLALLPQGMWWISLVWAMVLSDPRKSGERLLITAVVGLSLLTPFYHPYARLWLPLQLLTCLIVAGLLGRAVPDADRSGVEAPSRPGRGELLFRGMIAAAVVLPVFVLAELVNGTLPSALMRSEIPRILGASDSLRSAVSQAVKDIPPGTPGLRLLVRPPVIFYLGGRLPARTVPSLSAMLAEPSSGEWALVDAAQILQEGDPQDARRSLLSRWEMVREYPTQLNVPTLLDLDPSAARTRRSLSVECPLLLLRPRIQGPSS